MITNSNLNTDQQRTFNRVQLLTILVWQQDVDRLSYLEGSMGWMRRTWLVTTSQSCGTLLPYTIGMTRWRRADLEAAADWRVRSKNDANPSAVWMVAHDTFHHVLVVTTSSARESTRNGHRPQRMSYSLLSSGDVKSNQRRLASIHSRQAVIRAACLFKLATLTPGVSDI